jgi:glutamate carboxypeptidase
LIIANLDGPGRDWKDRFVAGIVTTSHGVARAVLDRARDELGLALADLEAWVNLDSPSDDGVALEGLAAVMAGRLERYGAATELAGGYLRARLTGSGRSRVALLGHHDTVFRAGTAAARPFALDGELARGPGVADMKGGLVVAAHVLRLLAGHPETFARLELISVPDEELRERPFDGIDRLRDFDAVLCFECGRPGNGVVTARKGGQWAAIRVAGVAAHAGVAADRGRSALIAACHEALRIAALDGARDGLTVIPTLLSAGESLNSVPSTGALRIDIRAWRTADLDWTLERLAEFGSHPGVTAELDPGGRVPAFERSGLLAAAQDTGEALGTPIVAVDTGGVSDANWTADLGIPTLDGLGPIGEDDHTAAERIVVSSLPERTALAAGVIAAVEAAKP